MKTVIMNVYLRTSMHKHEVFTIHGKGVPLYCTCWSRITGTNSYSVVLCMYSEIKIIKLVKPEC